MFNFNAQQNTDHATGTLLSNSILHSQ